MVNGVSGGLSSWASSLFSRLDTKNQGYIEKSDLQNAFSAISSTGSTSGNAGNTGVDEVFAALDSDSDGKLTASELSASLSKLASELDSQFNQMRMQGLGGHHGHGGGMSGPGGMGAANGMPPPPPPGDQGFSKEELQSQLQDIGSTDSKRSDLLNKIVSNFEAADTDSNGKVSFKEAMAYDKSSQSGGVSDANATTSSSNNFSTQFGSDLGVMLKVVQLMQAYGISPQSQSQSSQSQSLGAISA